MSRKAYVLCAVILAACANAHTGGGDIDAPPDDAAVDAVDATDACVPQPERCNGMDDDCDGRTDEDFATLGDACSAGMGACMRAGVYACDQSGTDVRCTATPGDPQTEICNGADDNCNGMVDEGFNVGMACDGPDSDLCAEGTIQCAPTGGGVQCSDNTGDNVETCNGMDDDCDSQTDEGFNLGAMCDGPDGDACQEGHVVCDGTGGTTCDDMTSTTVELCNGLDDDCRNGVDDGYAVGLACSTGVGACARPGTYQCAANGLGVLCNATAGSPTPETCGDGVDQDCNGSDVACPVNDLASGATNISNGGTFTVDLTAAHDDDTSSVTGCGFTGGRDVFYQLSLPAPEVVYLDTFGSDFDTVIRVYSGACTARTGTPTCDDDAGVCPGLQSQLATQLAAGTWCVVVDQYSSTQTTGALTLSVVRGGRTGTAIATGNGTQTGTTCGLPSVTTPSCTTSSAGEAAYFFTVCPSETRTVGANTCSTPTSWDSVVYLRQGNAGGTDLACNDDSTTACGSVSPIRLSSFSGVNVTGPGLFWLTVDGFTTNCGAYTLNYTM